MNWDTFTQSVDRWLYNFSTLFSFFTSFINPVAGDATWTYRHEDGTIEDKIVPNIAKIERKTADVCFATMDQTVIVASNVTTVIPFGAIVYDTIGIYDAASGSYIALKDGYYRIDVNLRIIFPQSGSSARVDISFYVNGSAVSGGGLKQDGATNHWGCNAGGIIYLNAGDTLSVYFNQNSGESITIDHTRTSNAGGLVQTLFIERIGEK